MLVLEARPGLGGRATSFRDPVTGERIDNGQHVLAGCYNETPRFLDRIGTSDRVRRQAGLSLPMIDERGRRSVLKLPPLPAPLHLLAGVLAWEALTLGRAAVDSARGKALRVPAAAIRGTARRPTNRRDGARVARSATASRRADATLFWEPLALAALNQSIDQAAARHLRRRASTHVRPRAGRASLLLPAVPLDELYADPARECLQAARPRGSRQRAGARARSTAIASPACACATSASPRRS